MQEPSTSVAPRGLIAPMGGASMELREFSPDWDFTVGGSKVIVTCAPPDGEVSSACPIFIMFDKEQARKPCSMRKGNQGLEGIGAHAWQLQSLISSQLAIGHISA